MIKKIIIGLAIITGLIVIFIQWIFCYKKSCKKLYEWANKNDYRIIYHDYRLIKIGPFFHSLRNSKTQPIFYVVLEDENGIEKKAWVKLGGYLSGLLSDEVKVKWENTLE